MERALVVDLAASRREGDPDWGERLYRAELTAPTRPHPYIPTRACPAGSRAPSPAGSTASGTRRRAGWCQSRCGTTSGATTAG